MKDIATALTEVGFLQGISSEVSQALKLPSVLEFGGKISTSWQKSYKAQFSKTIETNRTNTRSEKLSLEQSFEFATDSIPQEYLVLPQYFRVEYDLHLTHLDYLQVEYTREWSGLRKRRKKAPRFQGGGRPAANVLKLDIPLAKITTWNLYKAVVVQHAAQQSIFCDPRDVAVESLRGTTPFVEPVLRPSLYHLSNAAFPLRWIKLKVPWTEDDLKAAEMEEVLSEKGIWFLPAWTRAAAAQTENIGIAIIVSDRRASLRQSSRGSISV